MKKIYKKYHSLFNIFDCFLFGYMFARFGTEVTIITLLLVLNYTLKAIKEIDYKMEDKEYVNNSRKV